MKKEQGVAEQIKEESKKQGMSIGELARLGYMKEEELYGFIEKRRGISEYKLWKIEEVLGIEIDRSKLIPCSWIIK